MNERAGEAKEIMSKATRAGVLWVIMDGRENPRSFSVLAATIVLLNLALPTQGGQCWVGHVSRGGKCMELLQSEVSKEECCRREGGTAAWSAEDLSPGDLFFWRTFRGGVACQPCTSSCKNVRCGPYKRCVVGKDGFPRCTCQPCSKSRRKTGPVCGTDGRTYRHVCHLLRRRCKRGAQLQVSYNGACKKSCEEIRCPNNRTCLVDQNLQPHCVRCRMRCHHASLRPVCGADNSTYPSLCHLKKEACQSGKAIPFAYKGPCKGGGASCGSIKCRKGRRCLMDLRTSQPRCVSCPAPCLRAPIPLLKAGGPVCASNNRTYPSWCHMMEASCSLSTVLYVTKEGDCDDDNDDGMPPVPFNSIDVYN